MPKIYMVIDSLESEKGRGLPIHPDAYQLLFEKVHGFSLFHFVGFADSFEKAQLYFRRIDFDAAAFLYEKEVMDNIKEAIIECEVDGEGNVVALLEMHKLILKREGTSSSFFKAQPLEFEKLNITDKDLTSRALSEINRQYQRVNHARPKPT